MKDRTRIKFQVGEVEWVAIPIKTGYSIEGGGRIVNMPYDLFDSIYGARNKPPHDDEIRAAIIAKGWDRVRGGQCILGTLTVEYFMSKMVDGQQWENAIWFSAEEMACFSPELLERKLERASESLRVATNGNAFTPINPPPL